ncbi:MAG: hypothetical protein NT007_15385 [Candidatus Kapabacteria bacterium]|nr:hypothetical protein [Candidatus Kapabacteria bacterium]
MPTKIIESDKPLLIDPQSKSALTEKEREKLNEVVKRNKRSVFRVIHEWIGTPNEIKK